VASHGGKDRSPMGHRAAARLEQTLTANGVDHDIKVYPGASHEFLNDTGRSKAPAGRRA
jgi:carboxymethylenebutenolidase